MERRGPSVWAYIFIFVGAVLLLHNFNLLPWESWMVIWRFWPFILVLIGLQMVFGRSSIGNAVIVAVSLVLILFILLVMISASNSRVNQWISDRVGWWSNLYLITNQQTNEEQIVVESEKYPGLIGREFSADLSVANFSINDDSSDNLISVMSRYFNSFEEPLLKEELAGDTIKLNFTSQTSKSPFSFGSTGHDIVLGVSELRSDIDVSVGTGKADIDLEKLAIDSFKLNIGTGAADVKFARASLPAKDMSLAVGTGKLSINLPKGIGLKINHQVGLGSFSVDGLALRSNGVYQSSDFDDAPIKLELSASVGTGTIIITSH